MASSASAKTMASSLNPCCALWQAKCAKMTEGRVHLRNGMKILEDTIKSLENEKLDLHKAFKDQQNRADVLEQEKGKEASLRISLEDEITALKSKICSTESDLNCKNQELEKETLLLQTCISDKEGEIERLQKILAEEKSGSGTGKKISPSQKKKVAELQKKLQSEKNRADAAKRQSEEDRNLVDTLNNEVNCKNEELEKNTLFLRACISEKEGEIERLIKLLAEEKSVSSADKKVSPSEKKKVTELQKKLQAEKSKADTASKIAEVAKEKSEEDRLLVERLNNEVRNISQKLEETNKMLEAEKQRVIDEKKNADEEKARANELRRIVEVNEKKLTDEKCHANNLSMMLEEEKQKVEKFQKELREVMSYRKSTLSFQLDEVSKNLEAEKEKVVTEMKHADLKKSEKEEQKKSTEANMKKAIEERHRADMLLLDLQSSTQRIENLQKELTKVNCLLKAESLVSAKEKQRADALNLKSIELQRIAVEAEKSHMDKLSEKHEAEKKKVANEKKRADLEMSAKEEQKNVSEANIKKAMEEKLRADQLAQDLWYGRQRIETLEAELNKVNCMLEAERSLLANERNHSDVLKSKLEEQARIAIENEKRAMEEECRSDNMIQELEIVRQKLKDAENQLFEVEQSRGLAGASSAPAELFSNEQIAKVSLLQEQLKFEKKRVKHYKEVAKLEKDHKRVSQQELHNVKQDFECLLQQMDMLRDTFGARNHLNKKRRLNVQSLELPGRMPSRSQPQLDFCYEPEFRLSNLSSRDTSCHLEPNIGPVDAGQPMESPSVAGLTGKGS